MELRTRNVIKSIIFTIFTFGIYGIYWTCCIIKDSRLVSGCTNKKFIDIFLAILPPFVGYYFIEKKFAKGCEANGIEHTDCSLIYLILGFIPGGWFIIVSLFQSELNKIISIIS